jgi:ABC-2 type transport system ATP-binding protein
VELFFGAEPELHEAAAAVGGSADPRRLSLRVPSDGSADAVRDLLDRIDGVERIELHRPTLDDVFLELTCTGSPAIR